MTNKMHQILIFWARDEVVENLFKVLSSAVWRRLTGFGCDYKVIVSACCLIRWVCKLVVFPEYFTAAWQSLQMEFSLSYSLLPGLFLKPKCTHTSALYGEGAAILLPAEWFVPYAEGSTFLKDWVFKAFFTPSFYNWNDTSSADRIIFPLSSTNIFSHRKCMLCNLECSCYKQLCIKAKLYIDWSVHIFVYWCHISTNTL